MSFKKKVSLPQDFTFCRVRMCPGPPSSGFREMSLEQRPRPPLRHSWCPSPQHPCPSVWAGWPQVICYSLLLNMAIEIVDLPIENGGSFYSYVSLPEGSIRIGQNVDDRRWLKCKSGGKKTSCDDGLCDRMGSRWDIPLNKQRLCYGIAI